MEALRDRSCFQRNSSPCICQLSSPCPYHSSSPDHQQEHKNTEASLAAGASPASSDHHRCMAARQPKGPTTAVYADQLSYDLASICQRRAPGLANGASHVYSEAVRLCTFVLDDFNRWSKNSSYSRDHFFRDDKKLSPISWEHWCGGLLATARPGHHWKWCTSPIRQQEDPVPWCTGSALFQSRLALLLVLQCLPPGVCTRH